MNPYPVVSIHTMCWHSVVSRWAVWLRSSEGARRRLHRSKSPSARREWTGRWLRTTSRSPDRECAVSPTLSQCTLSLSILSIHQCAPAVLPTTQPGLRNVQDLWEADDLWPQVPGHCHSPHHPFIAVRPQRLLSPIIKVFWYIMWRRLSMIL